MNKSKRIDESLLKEPMSGIVILNRKMQIDWVNSLILKRYNIDDNERIKGAYCYKIFRNKEKVCSNCIVQKALKNERIESGIFQRKTKSGKSRLFNLLAFPIRNEKGKLSGVVEISFDMTEAKMLETRLIESENFYRTLFEHSGTAVAVIEEDRTISRVNKRFEELSGIPRRKIENKMTSLDFVDEEHKEMVSKIHDLRRSSRSKAPTIYEIPFVSKKLGLREVEINASIIPNSTRSIASLKDVTEERTLVREVRKKDILLENIFLSSVDAIIHVGVDRLITLWNKGAEKIFGYEEGEIIGEPYFVLIPENEREKYIGLKNIVDDVGYVQNYESTLLTKDGRKIICSSNLTALKDTQGSVWGYSLIIRDITELKKFEERMVYNERMEALVELSATLAHEIKNPLNSMVINLEVLKSYCRDITDEKTKKAKKYLDILTSEISRLDKVIRGFLDFARPISFNPKKIDLIEIVKNVLIFVEPESKKQSCEIRTKFPATPLFIFGDQDQIKQAILNIVLNSLQAMVGGGILRVEIKKGDDEFVTIKIQDSGCGIPNEIKDKIFDLYFTTKERGSGLGLPIVNRIVKGHNGKVLFESVNSEGAAFNLSFPIFKEK